MKTFDPLEPYLGNIRPVTESEYPILVNCFTAPYVNKVSSGITDNAGHSDTFLLMLVQYGPASELMFKGLKEG